MARIKGTPLPTGRADRGSTRLSLSGMDREHAFPRPKARGITRLFSGSRRSGGGRIRGAASEPGTISSGIVDQDG